MDLRRDEAGAGYPTIRSRPAQKRARSTFLSTLPTPVIGNSSTNWICFGACAEPLRLHEVDQFVGIGMRPFARNHHRCHRLAPFVVGHADHGTHRDIGMLRQHVLDLAWENVEAARY